MEKNANTDSGVKISKTTFICMLVFVGCFFDLPAFLLTFISPFDFGIISEPVKWMLAVVQVPSVWLMIRLQGIKVSGSTKSMLKFGGTSLIEFIPVLNILPGGIMAIVMAVGPYVAKDIVKDIGGKIPVAGKNLDKIADAGLAAATGDVKGALKQGAQALKSDVPDSQDVFRNRTAQNEQLNERKNMDGIQSPPKKVA